MGKWLVLLLSFLGAPQLALGFGIEELNNLIREKEVSSIEALLPLLPADLRLNYTLIHTSNSIQTARASAPRAILFGSDAQLVLTFNGSPQQTNFDHLEAMAFDESDKTFKFYDIDFTLSSRQKGGLPRVSKANPPICLQCHGSPPHPIWESYDIWTGAYGAVNDKLVKTYRFPEVNAPSLKKMENFQELKEYENFVSISKKHPRYRHLLRRNEVLASPYFTDGQNFRNQKFLPNLRLAELLSRRHAVALFERLRRSRYYPKYKYALLSSYLNCSEPTPLKHALTKDLPSKSSSTPVSNRLATLFGLDINRTSKDVWLGFHNYRRGKVQTSVYFDGYNSANRYVANLLYKDVAADLPEIAQYHQEFLLKHLEGPFFWEDHVRIIDRLGGSLVVGKSKKGCAALNRKTEESLKRDYRLSSLSTAALPGDPSPALSQASTRQSLFNKCIDCHTEANGVAPPIPFDNLPRLSQILSKDPVLYRRLLTSVSPDAGDAQMPKGASLSPQELKEIRDYLETIAQRAQFKTPSQNSLRGR